MAKGSNKSERAPFPFEPLLFAFVMGTVCRMNRLPWWLCVSIGAVVLVGGLMWTRAVDRRFLTATPSATTDATEHETTERST